jgi:hypothetical protein
MGTSHEDQYTLLIISRVVLLRMESASDKICRENKNSHFMLQIFRIPCLLWDNVKNILETDKPQITLKYGACTLRAG